MSVWRRHRAELQLSIRMTVAGLAAFALGHLLGVPQIYLAVLTAVIVTETAANALELMAEHIVALLDGAATCGA